MTYRAVLFDLFDTLLYVTPTGNRGRAVALLQSLGISKEDWWRGWQASFVAAVRGRTADLEERVAVALREAGAAPVRPSSASIRGRYPRSSAYWPFSPLGCGSAALCSSVAVSTLTSQLSPLRPPCPSTP